MNKSFIVCLIVILSATYCIAQSTTSEALKPGKKMKLVKQQLGDNAEIRSFDGKVLKTMKPQKKASAFKVVMSVSQANVKKTSKVERATKVMNIGFPQTYSYETTRTTTPLGKNAKAVNGQKTVIESPQTYSYETTRTTTPLGKSAKAVNGQKTVIESPQTYSYETRTTTPLGKNIKKHKVSNLRKIDSKRLMKSQIIRK